ncbi:MAG: leucyl aminopeptidase, partial [Actinobacteria bacterium]|nr:leucyl aminopeptidase [Actinomycetota bacterium]
MPLPSVVLAADLPPAVVLAVLTQPSDGGARLVGARLTGDGPPGLAVDVDVLLSREAAKGEAGEIIAVPVPGPGPLERVLLVGLGDGSPPALRKAGAALARRAKDAVSLAVDLRAFELEAPALRALVEGLLLASYRFSRKAEPKVRALQDVTLVGPVGQDELAAAVLVVTATAAARDLVNTPSLEKSPEWLADSARTLLTGLSVTVLDEMELRRKGFGGIVGVGQGSTRPPRLIQAVYDGGGSRHVVLVGKGITFDTGGLSLKPN